MYRLYICFFFIILGIWGCSSEKGNQNEQNDMESTEDYNVIFIMADDLGYGDLSAYGQTKFSTPNIDKLASEGMMFLQHYAGSTVCAPSRSSLLTGLHTGKTPVRGNKEIEPEGQYPLPDSILTIPKLFKEAGYVTGAFGKWGLGYPGSEGDPLRQFDTFVGYNCQRLAHNYFPHHLWVDDKKIVFEDNSGEGKGTYAPNVIHQKTLKFIEENKDKKFFLFVPSPIPHAELLVPEASLESNKDRFLPESEYRGVDSGTQFKKGGYGSQKYPRAAFVTMIELLDKQVGEIVDKVEAAGIRKRTMIIFTSDNGPHQEGGADPDYFNSNGNLRGYKRDLYEGGIRVPLIISLPGKVKPGSTSRHVSAFWDYLSTFADLLDIGKVDADGISFLPTLFGVGRQKEHQHLYWEFHEQGGRQAIRKDNWKGVLLNVKNKNDQRFELYDLQKDPSESKDLKEEYPEVAEELLELIKASHRPSPVFNFIHSND